MKNWRSGIFAAAVALLCLVFVNLQCSSGSDAAAIAKALAENLTDDLDFTGGVVVSDKPVPAGQAGTSAPQITDLTPPKSLSLGETFSFSITPDFEQLAQISGVIVHVGTADSYIMVAVQEPGSTILLQGTLAADNRVKGKDFSIKCVFRRCRSHVPIDADRSFRAMPIAFSERSDASG